MQYRIGYWSSGHRGTAPVQYSCSWYNTIAAAVHTVGRIGIGIGSQYNIYGYTVHT